MTLAAAHSRPSFTVEEYLDRERRTELKSEYLDGQIYAMSGASRAHSAIAANVIAMLVGGLRGRPCQAFTSDLKVSTGPAGLFAYPDASVVCGSPEFHDDRGDVLLNPILLVEVLSPSTEAYDRGRKFERYRDLQSLRDYVLVAQEQPRIELIHREDDGHWSFDAAVGLEGSLHLPAIDCTLRLADVYDKGEFR